MWLNIWNNTKVNSITSLHWGITLWTQNKKKSLPLWGVNSVRARLYTDAERRTYDRLTEKIILKRTELFTHNQSCKIADCSECVMNIFIHRTNQEVLGILKRKNPPMEFRDFIESLRYKRIFQTVIQQDLDKYKFSLGHLKIFDDIREL